MLTKTKKLSARFRRTQGFKPPIGIANAYGDSLRGFLGPIQAKILDSILLDWHSDSFRSDASNNPKMRLGIVKLEVARMIKPAQYVPKVDGFAKKVVDRNGDEFRRVVGISSSDTGLDKKIVEFRKENVEKITTLVDDQLDTISDLLTQADSGAWRVEVLRSKILESFDVTKSYADLLARDQVLSLNGQITETRQKGAGITKYIWTIVDDGRVRGDPNGRWKKGLHFDLDGQTFSWSDPPTIAEDGRKGHPGSDYQCRCTAFPVLDELEEDGEDG